MKIGRAEFSRSTRPIFLYRDMENKRKSTLYTFAQEEARKSRGPINNDKEPLLKNRLQTLITDRGLTMHAFLEKVGLSPQYWYYLSWGIWPTSPAIKRRICEVLNTDSSVIWGDGNG